MPSIVLCFRFLLFIVWTVLYPSKELVIMWFHYGKMKTNTVYKALRDLSPAFFSTLTCLHILNTVNRSLSQLDYTWEWSSEGNDLIDYFLNSANRYPGAWELILFRNPSGKGLLYTLTGLKLFSSFLPLSFSKAVPPARNTFIWPG